MRGDGQASPARYIQLEIAICGSVGAAGVTKNRPLPSASTNDDFGTCSERTVGKFVGDGVDIQLAPDHREISRKGIGSVQRDEATARIGVERETGSRAADVAAENEFFIHLIRTELARANENDVAIDRLGGCGRAEPVKQAVESDGSPAEGDVAIGISEGDAAGADIARNRDRADGEPRRAGSEIQGIGGGGVRRAGHDVCARRGSAPALRGVVRGWRGPYAARRAETGGGIVRVPVVGGRMNLRRSQQSQCQSGCADGSEPGENEIFH